MKNLLIAFLTICTLFLHSYANAQNWQWAQTGMKGWSEGFLIKTDGANNVVICGMNYGDSIYLGSHVLMNDSNYYQTIIAKYDSAGSVIWAKCSKYGNCEPMNIAIDNSGNTYVYGFFYSDSIGFDSYVLHNTGTYLSYNYFLVKYNVSGNVVWARNAGKISINAIYLSCFGGLGTDSGSNIYITGIFKTSSMTIGPNTLLNADTSGHSYDMFIAKYDSSGNVLWAQKAGNTGNDIASTIDVRPNGDFYVTGTFTSPNLYFGAYAINNTGYISVFTTKFDTYGNIKWAKAAPASNGAAVLCIASDKDYNIYEAGTFYDSIRFGTVALHNTSSVISEVYVTKCDSSGNVLWAKAFGTQGPGNVNGFENVAYGITIDDCNNVWVSGSMDTNIVLDSFVLVAPQGSTDPMFIAGMDLNGTVFDHQALSSGGDDNNGIAADKLNHIYISGDYHLHPFIVGPDTLKDTSMETIFVAKYNSNVSCGQQETVQQEIYLDISLYPNPAYSQFTIYYPGIIPQRAKVQLYNIAGQLVLTTVIKNSSTTISTTSLVAGVYFCKITGDGQAVITKRLVVE